MAREVVSLRIDIQHDTVDAAAKAHDRMTRSAERAAKAEKGVEDASAGAGDALGKIVLEIVGMSSEGSKASGVLSKLPLGPLASSAGLAAAAVIGLGAAMYGAAQFTREAARAMNDQLLRSIQDSLHGTAEGEAQFKAFEATMRHLRAETDALAQGFDSVEDAVAHSTETFVRNEAVVMSIDSMMPRLKDSLQALAVDGFARLYSETVAANEALIQTQVAASRAETAIRSVRELFGASEGIAGIDQTAAAAATSHRQSLDELLSSIVDLSDAEIVAGMTTNTYMTQTAQLARELANQGVITEAGRREMMRYISTADGAEHITRTWAATLGDVTQHQSGVAAASDAAAAAAGRQASAVREDNEELSKQDQLLKNIARSQYEAAQSADAWRAALSMLSDEWAIFNTELAAANIDSAAAALKTQTEVTAGKLVGLGEEATAQLSASATQAVNMVQQTMGALSGSILGGLQQHDEKAGKVIARMLGNALVAIGTTAAVTGAIGVVAGTIPLLQPLFGTPAQNAALVGLGAGAVAVGLGLGAAAGPATASATPPTAAAGSGQTGASAGTTQNYNVFLGPGIPRRARQRALIEETGDAIEAAA